uniref:Uncharacterized protein n=1 Tax=Meloidogyne hapla TaxID=6305 RepID=A0A1I8BDE5_MELHA
MDNLSSLGNLRKRMRQTPSPLHCPPTKKRGFLIDQLLEDKPMVTVDLANNLKLPMSPTGTNPISLKRGRKGGKADNFPETERKSAAAIESPPLDDYNWLPARPNSSSLSYLKCELENREIW